MAEERESWGNHIEFFLSSLGLAVGLGNVWRFPYVAFENGGGSFLIPYTLALLFVGLPAFFLELSAGQYARVGANKVWGRMVPALKGLGYGMIFVRFLVNIYYVVICSWANIYLVVGLQKNLPWASCGDFEANTINCYSTKHDTECKETTVNTTYYNSTCLDYSTFCSTFDATYNSTLEERCVYPNGTSSEFSDMYTRVSPADNYYFRVVLGLIKEYEGNIHTFEDYGEIKWELVVSLLVSWVLICLILIKGLKSLGKAAYVITLSPYLVLTVLLAYSAGREGAGEGIKQFFTPDWDVYTSVDSVEIWATAASQILFSLSVGFGSQLVLSSYNDVKNNCHRDALLIGLMNSLTSVFAGVVVFAILGNLAEGGDVSKVIQGGIGLAFVAYPEAVLKMDPPPLWSFFFFFMLINLALSSICGGVQTFLAFILDEKPSLTKYRIHIVVGSCALFFLLGLPMCTTGGIHLFNIFDKRCTSSLLLLCLVEVILISWAYGAEKFLTNIEEMGVHLSKPTRMMLKVMWIGVSPVIIAIITILKWVQYKPMEYNGEVYPDWVQVVGWIFEIFPSVITAGYFIYSNIRHGWSESMSPSLSWDATNASSILMAAKVNEAFFDDAVYKVSPTNSLPRGSLSKEPRGSLSKEPRGSLSKEKEKMTEL